MSSKEGIASPSFPSSAASSAASSNASSAASSAANSDAEEDEDDASSQQHADSEVGEEDAGTALETQLAIAPLARRARSDACCELAIPAGATILDLKRRLRRALASSGAHPPHQPAARVRTSLSASRLRLHRRLGTRVGVVLRDEQKVGVRTGANAAASANANGTATATDAEVVLHLLAADERLVAESIVLGCVTLDAAASAASTSTIVAHAEWSVPTLTEALSSLVGIPRRQLAIAKLAQAGGGAVALTPQQLGSLSWDEPELLAAHKLSAPPLALCDGDVIVVRDRHHPAPMPAGLPEPHRRSHRERRSSSSERGVRFDSSRDRSRMSHD